MKSREDNTGCDILPVDHSGIGCMEASRATASTTSLSGGWRVLLAAVPGVGAALLLGATCPACWMAYAGLLTMPGLAWLVGDTSLIFVTVTVLGIALASFAYRAPARRGYGPLGLGVVAASLVLIGKFLFPSPLLPALGLASLVGASLWNAWPRQATSLGACAACTPQASAGKPASAPERSTR